MSCVLVVVTETGVKSRAARRLSRHVPVAFPANHLVAGQARLRERLADEIRNEPEILGRDLRGRVREEREDPLALRDLIRLVAGVETTGRLANGARVRPKEADEMIDAVAVIQAAHALHALAQPAIVLGAHHVPAVDRQPPVLSGRAERVRRRARRPIESKQVLVGPDVGAVDADHEREVAEQSHVAQLLARGRPLLVGQPLRVLVKENLALELASGGVDRLGLPMAQRIGPLRPGTSGVPIPERAVKGVVARATTLPRNRTRQTIPRARWCAPSRRPRSS